jgi:autophagy-related protein 2
MWITERAEVYPVVLKLDYKPRRVDYRALREGRTIELMNFFHFDGAEMTLRHLTLFGVSDPSIHPSYSGLTFSQVAGWPRFFDMLNDLWTPDVKATQLADVISGVSPIRSVVNVGSGVADLVLLPITQYRKDGRVVRGLQKGTKAFVRSTAMEAIKLGAQLATGTQVILEQAENVLGSGFGETILAETVSHPSEDAPDMVVQGWGSDEESTDPISRYAEQPVDIREGIQSAYTSIRRNLSSAAQTILAVPMEVFERSGSEARLRIHTRTRTPTYHHLGTCSCRYSSGADCRVKAHDRSKRSGQQNLARAS